MAGNILQWLGGGTIAREQADTRRAWAECERAWAVSPLGSQAVWDIAFEFVRDEVIRTRDRLPVFSIVDAMNAAADDVIDDEDIGPITPRWPAIDGDAKVAVEFRKLVARRKRYALDFEHMHGLVCGQLQLALDSLIEALPPSALYDEETDGAASFEVPLVELLEDPADLIERFLLFPYTDETLRLDLFAGLRGVYQRNLVAASGLPPTFNPVGQDHRIKSPSEQRNMTPAELVDAYLTGTPFRPLLEAPVPFHVPEEARFEHCHILGGTGHGKTQLMQRMIYGDLEQAQKEKRSVVVIDSQGDLIGRLVRLGLFSPGAEDSLADRLVVIDPADVEFPAALNLFDAHINRLEGYTPVDRERVLNGVVELYETFFGALLGAELTQKQGVIFKYLARLMLTIPDANIHTLMRLMEDGKSFKPHMDALDGSARYFFETEFFHPSFAATKKQILRRLWGVLSTPAFERMFAQTSNKLDLFEAMQDGKIILISTAKDLLKREGSQLFGQFFIAMIAQAALERSTVPADERTPSMVYVDEAQEYFGDDVETILNQARKYRVGLTLAHQTLDQLSPRLRSVLHSNTSMKCVGGVSSKDARAMADELHTTSEFIESMRRRDARTEFAVWIKHQMPHAIRLAVPLGFLERQPVLSENDYDALVSSNRKTYCGTLASVSRMEVRPHSQATEPPKREASREASDAAANGPSEEPAATVWSMPATDAASSGERGSRPEGSRPRSDPTDTGKGGAQHRYVQHLIKQLAEDRGFRAVVEEAVPGGHVDVGLHRENLSIGCEISITSSADYEAQNLAKCVAAGFGRIWSVAPDAKRQRALRKAAEVRLASEDFERVQFFTTAEVVLAFDEFAEPDTEESVVRGYKVSVSRKAVSPEDARHRRAAIARIVAQSSRDSE